YTVEERAGFTDALALAGVAYYALVTLSRRGICCLRPGNKPALRGTIIEFGEKKGLVYTIGYVPFLRCYPGFRIPQPLEITENWGSLTFREVAADLLRLTKLNWNTAAFLLRGPHYHRVQPPRRRHPQDRQHGKPPATLPTIHVKATIL